jgi:hypothetical protein
MKLLICSCRSAKSILKDDLNMCQITTEFMPHLLSEEQKQNCVIPYQDFEDPPLTLDLVSCEFVLIPRLKVVSPGRRFYDITMFKEKSWDGLGEYRHTS